MAQNVAAAVNHGEGLSKLPETSSQCVMEGAVHNFEITNFEQLEGMAVGNYITSSTFSAGGYDWNMKFYPEGSKENSAGNASAFLYYRSEAKDVRTKFTLTMLDDQGNAQEINKDHIYEHIFPRKRSCKGHKKFVDKSNLKSSLHLTLRCVLNVIKELPTECKRNPIVVHPPSLPGDLQRALENRIGADVTLLMVGREFRAHKFMLAARSPVFYAQLFGPMMDKDTQHIEVDDMEPAIFEMLLHFIYTDSVPPCNENKYDVARMQHLLVAADRYGLDSLKVICEEKLCNSIGMETVMSTLALANQHYCQQLKDACVEFMSAPGAMGIVSLTEEFKRLMSSCTPVVLGKGDEEEEAQRGSRTK